MPDEKKNLAAFNKKRISVLFVRDHGQYNAGESAGFESPMAFELKKLGYVEFNEHEVRNDTNVMGLLNGSNSGSFGVPGGAVSESKVVDLIDKKLDEKLKPLFELLEKANKLEEKEPLKGAIRK